MAKSKLDTLPKSIIKALRYIKQDAPYEKLKDIKKELDHAIQLREKSLTENRRF